MTIFTKKGEPLLYEKESYSLRGLWMEIYNKLGPGHKEIVYSNAFEELLKQKNILYVREPILPILLDNKKVGNYRPDFIIYNKIIIEFKSILIIPRVFIQKIYQYLKSSNYKLGFIVNFGTDKLEIVRRVYDTRRGFSRILSADFADNKRNPDNPRPQHPRSSACNPDNPRHNGFIALISLLIVLSVALTIGLSVSLLGIEESKTSFGQSKSFESFYNADACMEEAFMRIKRNSSYSGGSLSINGNDCIITVTADDDKRTIVTSSSANNFIRKTQAEVTLVITPKIIKVVLNKWEEVTD